jgi:hypothetical protein
MSNAKPFGYYSLSQNNALIKDITESFGDGAAEMTEDDRLWVIGRISHDLWLGSEGDQPPTDEAEEITNRLHELKKWEKLALLKALINQ